MATWTSIAGFAVGAASLTALLHVRRTTRPAPRRSLPPAPLTAAQVKEALAGTAREFLHSCDIAEARRQITELRRRQYPDATSAADLAASSHELGEEAVKRCVYVAYEDSTPRGSEVTATLLSGLVLRGVIPLSSLRSGLSAMCERVRDSALDAPRAVCVLSDVMAQLVLDDTLEEAFLADPAHVPSFLASEVRARLSAEVPHALSQSRAMYVDVCDRFLHGQLEVWDDVDALSAALASMNARHLLHELVFSIAEAVVRPGSDALVCARACAMMAALADAHIITTSIAVDGGLRVLRAADALVVESGRPDAAAVLGRFLALCVCEGVLPDTFTTATPELFHLLAASPVAHSTPSSPSPAKPSVGSHAEDDDSLPPPMSRLALRAQRSSDGTWLLARSPSHVGDSLAHPGASTHTMELVLDAATRELAELRRTRAHNRVTASRTAVKEFPGKFVLVDAAAMQTAAAAGYRAAVQAVASIAEPEYRRALLYRVLSSCVGESEAVLAHLSHVTHALVKAHVLSPVDVCGATAAVARAAELRDADADEGGSGAAAPVASAQVAATSTLLAVLVPLVRAQLVTPAEVEAALAELARTNTAAATVLRRVKRV